MELTRGNEMEQYVIEAERLTSGQPQYEHVGYVNKIFETRDIAAEFYHEQYPECRYINMGGDWISQRMTTPDVLRYRIVPYAGQDLTQKEAIFIDQLVLRDLNEIAKTWQSKGHTPSNESCLARS